MSCKHLGVSIYDNDEPYRDWNTMSDKCMAEDVLVVPPRDYQLRHLTVIPPARLACSPATGLTCRCDSNKLSRGNIPFTHISLVRIKLTRNNYCERGLLLGQFCERGLLLGQFWPILRSLPTTIGGLHLQAKD